MVKRLTTLFALVTLAFAAAASNGAAAATPAHGRISGVVPHFGQPLFGTRALSPASLGYAAPATLTFDASYESLINRYFADVAAASGTATNVYSVATQYYDNPGTVHVQYSSTVGGSYVSHDPLPASACADGFDQYCLSDTQLQQEIQRVLTEKGWQGGLSHMFFLLTPNGVGSCDDSGVQCSTNAFCAYHSFFIDSRNEDVIYANEPYEGPVQGCAGIDTTGTDPNDTQGFPNDVDSDTTINTISHEHNEAITDPLTDPSSEAWITADLAENGDLCAYTFGTQTNPGASAYNQVINGHHYDLQQEYSNLNKGCLQHLGGSPSPVPQGNGTPPLVYKGGPVMHTNTTYAIYWLPTAGNTSLPVVNGTAVVNQTLTTSAGAWTAAPRGFFYQWQRCSSTGTSCSNIAGATATTYKLTEADAGHTVRSSVRATNVNGQSLAAFSNLTPVVVDVPSATKAPHVSGRAKVGKKLSGSTGTWTYSPTAYRYQWQRCNAHGGGCSNISHASHATYKLTRRDAGHRLRLRVTATNAAGSTTAASSPTGRVKR
jgi:hypothetical protein